MRFARLFLATLALSSSAFASSTTVSTSSELVTALKNGVNEIYLIPGKTYNAPGNGKGFQVGSSTTTIGKGPGQGTVTIQCTPNTNAIGFNVVGDVTMSDITVKNCGTAMYIQTPQSTFNNVAITSDFNNNGLSTGFHIIFGSTVTIQSSSIVSSTGFAGIYNYGTCYVRNTIIQGNDGGGIITRYSSTVEVSNSQIKDNKGSGIWASEDSTVRVTDTTISGNKGALYGGAIGAINSYVTVTRGTISGNTAKVHGQGIYMETTANPNPYTLTVKDATVTSSGNSKLAIYFLSNFNDKVTVTNSMITSANFLAPNIKNVKYCCNNQLKDTVDPAQVCQYPPSATCGQLSQKLM